MLVDEVLAPTTTSTVDDVHLIKLEAYSDSGLENAHLYRLGTSDIFGGVLIIGEVYGTT